MNKPGFKPFLRFASEGWLLTAPFLIVAGWAGHEAHWGLMVAAALPALLLLVLFHDPDRHVPPSPLGIVAPADGVVESVEKVHDPVLKREAQRIRIRVAWGGAYSLRSPSEGMVCAPPARIEGRPTSWVRTDEGDSILVVCSSGSLLGTVPLRIPYGQRVGQGKRCGMRRLARQIDVYVPAACRVEVETGQRVRSGADLIATLLRRS